MTQAPRRRLSQKRVRRALASFSIAFAAVAVIVPPVSAKTPVAEQLDALSRQITQGLTQRGVSDTMFDVPSYFWLLTHPEGSGTKNLPASNQKSFCRTVVQVGDSTSVGLDNSVRVPSPTDRLSTQYRRIGVANTYLDAMNGRSIVERRLGIEPSGLDAIDAELKHGRDGCWVIALGTNDAAYIAQGSSTSADRRIDLVMRRLVGRPVLWPTVMTADPQYPDYDRKHMQRFNAALKRATHRYPNLRVFDFARYTDPSWYIDGVHFTGEAMVQRNRLLAVGLSTKFPQR